MTATVVHSLPGRLRVAVPRLRRDARAAAAVRARLRRLPGVGTVRANPLTGSILVEHDGRPGGEAAILSCLADAGHAVRAQARAAATDPVLEQLAGMLARAVLERCLERAVRMVAAGLV